MSPRKRRPVLKKVLLKTIMALLLLLSGILLLDYQIRPFIKQHATYHTKQIATRVINNAVIDTLSTANPITTSDFIELLRDSDNHIIGAQTNTAAVNNANAEITAAVLASFKQFDMISISLPLGTLSGIQLFSGQGPDLQFKLIPIGYPTTKFISKFESAGINQTLHQIILQIDVEIAAFIPGYYVTVEVPYEFVIAQTVIVGYVPESYTNVITNDLEEIPSLINDFGAENFLK